MNLISLLIVVLRFLLTDLPRILEALKLASKDSRYKNEAERIDAAVALLRVSQGRDKLGHLKELEK